MVNVKFPNLERASYDWFLDERMNNIIISNDFLKAKALEFHSVLDTELEFEASNGWIPKFQKRHGIRSLKICGDKLSSNDSEFPNLLKISRNGK